MPGTELGTCDLPFRTIFVGPITHLKYLKIGKIAKTAGRCLISGRGSGKTEGPWQ